MSTLYQGLSDYYYSVALSLRTRESDRPLGFQYHGLILQHRGCCFNPMRVLISNDDGYGSRGLKALAQESAHRGEIGVGPDPDRRGDGNSLTLAIPVQVWRSENEVISVPISSLPVDMTRYFSLEPPVRRLSGCD